MNLNLLGKNCLDLFAGTGSLGIEAASMGSNYVTLLENNKINFTILNKMKYSLGADNINILNIDAISYIRNFKFKIYDILFIDPPYSNLDILIKSLKYSFNILRKESVVYVETTLKLQFFYNYFIFYLKIIKNFQLNNKNFFLFKFR